MRVLPPSPGLIAVALAFAAWLGLAVASTDREVALHALAGSVDWPLPRSDAMHVPPDVDPATGRGAVRPHPLGVQTVAIERAVQKRATGDEPTLLYQYDHTHQRARRVVIDATGSQVLAQAPTDGVHLPLNTTEIAWALERVRTSADALPPDAVLDPSADARRAPTAFVFEPVDPTDACARRRCALLGFRDPSGEVLADERVVEFPTGRVRRLPTGVR